MKDTKELIMGSHLDTVYAEGMAILHVLQTFENVTIIFTDSLSIVKLVDGTHHTNKYEINELVSAIKKYNSNLVWIPSQENKAHNLAYNLMKKISKPKPILILKKSKNKLNKHTYSKFPPKKNKELFFNEKWYQK